MTKRVAAIEWLDKGIAIDDKFAQKVEPVERPHERDAPVGTDMSVVHKAGAEILKKFSPGVVGIDVESDIVPFGRDPTIDIGSSL